MQLSNWWANAIIDSRGIWHILPNRFLFGNFCATTPTPHFKKSSAVFVKTTYVPRISKRYIVFGHWKPDTDSFLPRTGLRLQTTHWEANWNAMGTTENDKENIKCNKKVIPTVKWPELQRICSVRNYFLPKVTRVRVVSSESHVKSNISHESFQLHSQHYLETLSASKRELNSLKKWW